MVGRTVVVGEVIGFTGETAIDNGTGDEESGVDPVGVVLPLLGYRNKITFVLDDGVIT